MHLSSRDLESLLRSLRPLYACRAADAVLAESLRIVQSIIPADHVIWTGFEMVADAARMTTFLTHEPHDWHQLYGRMERGFASHPMVSYYVSGTDRSALMLSDFARRARENHRGAYEEVYRALDMNHLMGMPLIQGSDRLLSIGLIRKKRDFTERDRSMLNLISPHIVQAHANAQVFASLYRGPADFPSCVSGVQDLSARESEVAFWLARGKTNIEIGVILGISRRTVEKHVEHVLAKLGVDNRFAAAVLLGQSERGREDLTPQRPTR